MGFVIDTGGLSRGLADLERRRLFAAETYGRNAAKRLETSAKNSAPWRDRSGHARGGLRGTSARNGSIITITLSGSVRYLVYLELAHQKRWAILWPALQKHQQEILDGFARAGGLR